MGNQIIGCFNAEVPLVEFERLMRNVDIVLNQDAVRREAYYQDRNGHELEQDVFNVMKDCAAGTPFEGRIELVSGTRFPDIVANRYYGVEVKSTKKNKWTSIGSSILESTRISDVERIFLTFGKLGSPVEFMSKPYEFCMSGISVTHYPRYQIDMQLLPGETIFDKMGIAYDELRNLENPVVPVADYYKSHLKAGQKLWWSNDADVEETAAPAVLQLWSALDRVQKDHYTALGCALYPEILGISPTKYQNFSLWLASDCGIINTSVRDIFSAGGTVNLGERMIKMPAVFGRINKHQELIAQTIESASESILKQSWQVAQIDNERIKQWCLLVANYAQRLNLGKKDVYDILHEIFLRSS